MKKVISVLLTLVLSLSLFTVNAYASSSVKADYFPSGKVTAPEAPYVEEYNGDIYLWSVVSEDLLALGADIQLDSGAFYEGKYGLNNIEVIKEIDVKVNNGTWFSEGSNKTINKNFFVYDTADSTDYATNYLYTTDKINCFIALDNGVYVDGDATNNGILNGYVTESGKLNTANNKFSFRVRYKLVADYTNGKQEIVYSDWSDATSIGKGATAQTITPLSSKPAKPVITSVESYITGDTTSFQAIVDIPLSVYQDDMYLTVKENKSGSVTTETQYRINGGAWTDANTGIPHTHDYSGSELNSDFGFSITSGVKSGDIIEIRTRINEDDKRYSDWSDIAKVTVGKKYVNPNAPDYKTNSGISSLEDGATLTQVDNYIQSLTSEADPKGTSFALLTGRQKKVTKNAVTLSWKKVKNASFYVVYGAKCGKNAYKKLTKTGKTTFTNKKLKKGTYYKYIITAFNKNNKLVGSSCVIHVATKGGKICNYKKIKTSAKKNAVTLAKKGKTFKLKAKGVKESSKLKVKNHRKLKFVSSNKKIATVDSKGKITAKKKGTCYIYVYAQNGMFAKIKVTVKK